MKAPRHEPRDGFVAVARVLRPWGLRGDLKVESLSDFPERFSPGAKLWLSGVERTVERSRMQGGATYLKLSAIEDATQAEPFRGELLEVPEAALPNLDEDEFYHHQLVGLRARTVHGEVLGAVSEVLQTGGNAVLVVLGSDTELLVPFIDDVVKSVDLDAGVLTVELIDGLMPDQPERREPEPRPRPQRRWRRPHRRN
jgi:16S rRNA processing protein RimM